VFKALVLIKNTESYQLLRALATSWTFSLQPRRDLDVLSEFERSLILKAYWDPRTNTQMLKDAIEQGDAFKDGDYKRFGDD